MWIILRCWFGVVLFWASSTPPPLRRYPSVLGMGKMVAVEYEGEAQFFHQRLILRTASTAAMAQHHLKDVRFSERPLLDTHSRWRRVSRAPSPAGDTF